VPEKTSPATANTLGKTRRASHYGLRPALLISRNEQLKKGKTPKQLKLCAADDQFASFHL
jgi:hypothetical protein